jgi:hypothetical protein
MTELLAPDVPAALPHCIDLASLTIVDDGESQRVRVTDSSGQTLAEWAVDDPAPDFASAMPPVIRIRALDILEHVVDEEAWLSALAEVLTDDGELTVRVPLEGPLAWLDALNIYRYVQDTTGVGKDLEETKMKGWHRHYPVPDLVGMLTAAGLEVTSVTRAGSPHVNALHLAALGWGVLLRRKHNAEQRIRRWRDAAAASTSHLRLGPFSSSLTVTARKRVG